MRAIRAIALAFVMLAASFAADLSTGPPSAAAQGGCAFTLGFATLRELIVAQYGDVVGRCLENERFNAANGNAEQRTTGGLLVWRKADNWTAFTDGSRTWLNGPEGLASRPNAGPLFPWEAAAPPTVPSAPSAGLPSYRQYMAARLQALEQNMGGIAAHFGRVQTNNQLVLDPAWRAESNRLLGETRRLGGELQAYAPVPAQASALDATLKSIGRDLVYFADETAAGINNLDVTRLNNGKARLEAIQPKIEVGKQQIAALGGQAAPAPVSAPVSAPAPATAPAPAAPPPQPPPTPARTTATTTPATTSGRCDPSYPDVCIPPYPPDLNCPDIPYTNFRVVGRDPHRFDGDNDGIGCERR